MTNETGEFSISDKLYRVSEATNGDGTVDVTITEYDELDSGELNITFMTPTGDIKNEVMPFPKEDSADYKFVRLCRATVGSLTAADFLNEGEKTVKADPDTWSLEPSVSAQRKLKDWYKNTSKYELFIDFLGLAFGIGVFVAIAGFIGAPIYGVLTVFDLVPAILTAEKMIAGMGLSVAVGFIFMTLFAATEPDE